MPVAPIDIQKVHHGAKAHTVNQIAKRANETRSIYAEDVEDLRGQYATLWEAANKILIGLAKIK